MDGVKIIALNRRARFDYAVEENFECGIVLLGSEVKSLRMGKVSFPDGYAVIEKGEFGCAMFISPNTPTVRSSTMTRPTPQVLVHAHELKRLERRVREKGYTLIPLDFHFRKGRVKVEIGLCKGKKFADKRESIKERDVQRDLQRDFRDRQR
jgi:SsrA-binding protein